MKLRNFCTFSAIISIFSLATLGAVAADNSTNTTPIVATDEPKEAKTPGNAFTNSVKMELVKVGDAMWAGKFEVTQREFEKIMASNPSQFKGPTLPVDSVTWNEAVDFCQHLTDQDIKAKTLPKGFYYTLPTEDEWRNLMADADLKNAVTSVSQATRSGSSAVGSLGANSLGLYDMRGNVLEFCLSDTSKPFRFLKGGSWQDFTEINLRPEFRWYCKPDERKNVFGFRCILKMGSQP